MANVQLWCLVIVAVAKDPLFKVLYPRLPPPVHTFWPQKEKGRIDKDEKHNFLDAIASPSTYPPDWVSQ